MWNEVNRSSWYDTAQICLNGHVINTMSKKYPDSNKPYCDICGEKTITHCESCNKGIRGYYHVFGVVSMEDTTAPSYCIHCGQAFPWLVERLKVAEELAEIVDDMSEEDKKLLTTSLNDLVRETPRSHIAALQFKKVVSRTEPNIKKAFHDILIDVVTEPVKNLLWG